VATWTLVVSSVVSFCSLLVTVGMAYRLRAMVREEASTRAAVVQLAATVDTASQAWYWTPEWQKGEAEADEDLASNRLTQAETVDEMFDVLDEVSESYAPTSS